MSEFDLGNKGLKITKFTNWADNDKLHKNGKNAFKVFRKLKKQLKAEAFSGKASSLDKYPAEPYVVKLPTVLIVFYQCEYYKPLRDKDNNKRNKEYLFNDNLLQKNEEGRTKEEREGSFQ